MLKLLLEFVLFHVFGIEKMLPPLRGELRGGSGGISQSNHRFIFLSHHGEGGKMHQAWMGRPKELAESSCRAGLAACAALAGVAKPARRRATREMRAKVFIGELLSKRGVKARFILPFL